MTGLQLISAAMKTIGALAAGETPSSEEASDCLLRLNDLIDNWATQRLTIYYQLRTTKTLTANTTSYTIGTGGAINIVRPTLIEAAGLIIDTTATTPTEIPIEVFTLQQWQAIAQKTLTAALSRGIFYDYGWTSGLAVIYPWPIPTVSTTQLVLYTPQALTAMTLAGTYTFPPGYARLLRMGLARDIAPEFARPWTGDLQALYEESIGDVKRANIRLTDLSVDRALLPRTGFYDLYTDSVR